jgi:hypothetical protein
MILNDTGDLNSTRTEDLHHVLRMMALAIERHESEELSHVLNGLTAETK